ncbi:hypothetical protein M1M34_gp037 [Haloarcula tailed virus 2]|uniref:Uncharacterized protein n=1 Tax=Haloarcula tailed virus 2 TaxID=2877989 RepID=A0AAE8Y1M0_9CAUD|nr:hypothetical protein M1M34_gp037 [Haloarcula tailed virus 2]UBF23188.1 hypothetical protein HATV-2_gp37 [Haloarcula tailed virus 2]
MAYDGRKRIEQYNVPESFANWELYESKFTAELVVLVYRHKSGNMWMVVSEAHTTEGPMYEATAFVDGEAPTLANFETGGLLYKLEEKMSWEVTAVSRYYKGGASQVYDYVQL